MIEGGFCHQFVDVTDSHTEKDKIESIPYTLPIKKKKEAIKVLAENMGKSVHNQKRRKPLTMTQNCLDWWLSDRVLV